MANQDFRVKNGLQVGLGASVVGIVTAESFSGSAVGLTNVPSASLTGTISSERLSGTYNIDILGTVSGNTINATTATISEQLNVGAGDTGVFATATDGTLSVSGVSTFKDTTDNTLGDATTGAVQIRGGLGISSNVTVGGGLSVTGDSYFVGMVTFASGTDGNISIGDSAGDNVIINAQIDSDLIPYDDGTYNLGSSTKEWQDLYIDGTANIDSLAADTAAIGDLTDNQVVVAGTSGELEGDANLTYDGTELIVGTATTGSVVRTDGTLNVSGIATFKDRVIFDSTNSIQIPVGTDAEKDAVGTAVTGQIRYNTTNSQFEGFGPGNDWGSLGGVKDVDGDTYVKPESSPGSDEDALTFFTAGTERAVIDSDGNVGIATTNPTATLDLDGTLNVSGIATFQDRVIFDSTNSIQIPVGTSTERDAVGTAVTGQIRYNTTLSSFEGYGPGGEWGTLGGVKDIDQDTYITAQKDLSVDDDVLRFYTNGTEQVSIDSTGKVGIGSTQPTAKLDVDGTLNVTGVSTFQGNVNLPDDVELTFGNSPDLKIYHDGGNASYIRDVGTGNLNIDSTGGNIQIRVNGSESAIIAKQNNAVELYYDAVKKFETTADGIKVLNGTSETAVISGPQNIILDPSPDDVVAIVEGDISAAGVSTITGITTTNIAVGNLIQEVDGVISAGTTVTSVGISSLTISNVSLGVATNQEFTFVNQTPTGIVRIKGDLYVDGTRTEINSTTLTIDDLNVVVASGATDGLTADGAGITVDGANAYLKYNYNAGTNENWEINKNLNIGIAATSTDLPGLYLKGNSSTTNFLQNPSISIGGTTNSKYYNTFLVDAPNVQYVRHWANGFDINFSVQDARQFVVSNTDGANSITPPGVSDNQIAFKIIPESSTELRYNKVKKLETTGYGVSVYGGANVSGISTFQDDVNIGIGGTVAFFDVSSGNIGIGTDNPLVALDVAGAIRQELHTPAMPVGLNDDIGVNWTKIEMGSAPEKIGALVYCGNGIVLAGGGAAGSGSDDGDIYRSTDFGLTFTKVEMGANLETIYSLVYCGNGIVLAGSGSYPGDGDVYRSTDFGQTWTKIEMGPGLDGIYSLVYCGNGIVLAGSGESIDEGDVYRSTDFGLTFTKVEMGNSLNRIDSLVYCGNGIVLAGSGYSNGDGDVYKSTDFGQTWTKRIEMGPDVDIISSLVYCGNGIVLAGGGWANGEGEVYRSTDFGESFTAVESQMELDGVDIIYSLVYCGNGIVLAGAGSITAPGGEGDVYRSTDFGQTWTKIYDTGLVGIYSLVYCGNGIVLAGGGNGSNQGDIYRSDVGFSQASTIQGIYHEHLTGNIGIGSTQPTAKLDVNGDLNVSGVSTFQNGIHADVGVTTDIALKIGGNTEPNSLEFKYRGTPGSRYLSIDSLNNTDIEFRTSGNFDVWDLTGNNHSLRATPGGSVELYHNNNNKLRTYDYGIDVTGRVETDTLNVSGVSTFHDDIWIPDNKIIYHYATASGGNPVRIIVDDADTNMLYREYLKTTAGVGKSTYVSVTSSGVDYEISLGNADNFYIGSNGIIPFNDYPNNISFEVDIDGATSLYYNHNKKLETTGYGVSVTDGLNVSGIVTARSFVGSGELLTNLDAYAAYTSDRSTLATIADKISGIATYSEDQGFNYLGGNESYHGNSFFYGVDIEASDDGKVMFVSSIPNGTGNQAGCGVQIYERTNSNFNYVGFVTSLSHHTLGAGQTVGDLGTWFGPTLASNADASIFAVGSPNAVSNISGSDTQYGWWDSMNTWEGRHGCVNIFQKTGNNIEPLGILTAPDVESAASQFGQALAFSSDGTKLYVSAVGIETTAYGLLANGTPQHGLVYAYNKVGTSYQQVGVLTSYRPNDITFPVTWGHRVVCSDDGDTIYISGPSENPTNDYDREGLVEVYSRTGNTFTHVGILTCMHDPNVDLIWNNADFGISMDCSSDGNIIAIAANPQYNATQTPQGGYGALFVFEKTGTNTFSKIVEEVFDANTVVTNNMLEIGKYDLRVNSDASVIVMSASEVTGSGSDPGGHFVAFSRDGGNISKIGTFTPLTPQPSGASFDFMMFGNSLAIDSTGDNIFVGAPVHPLGSTSNSLADKGSAYVFNVSRQIALHSNQITGNIGIGTDNPTSSLDVDGTLNVSGISTFQDDINVGAGKSILWDGTDNFHITTSSGHGLVETNGELYFGTTHLYIQKPGGTTTMAEFIQDGAVKLNHNNSTKLQTHDYGIDVTGRVETDTLNVSGITTVGSPVATTGITTNFKVQDGNAYWAVEFAGSGNARGPYVASNGGSGGMYLSGDSDFAFTNYAGNELYLQFERSSGRVNLAHGTGANYSTRLSTTEYGIDVTGRVETDTLNVSGITTISQQLLINDFADNSSALGTKLYVNGPSVFQDDVRVGVGGTIGDLLVSGNVGIGTTQPTAKLDVDGTLNVSGISTFQDDVNIGTGGTTTFFDVSSGRVGIGITNPTKLLDVGGTLGVSGISYFTNAVSINPSNSSTIPLNFESTSGFTPQISFKRTPTARYGIHYYIPFGQDARAIHQLDSGSNFEIGLSGGSFIVGDNSSGGFPVTTKAFEVKEDAETYLTHNHNKKIETTGYGVSVTGGLNVSGIATAQKFIGDGSELTNLPPAGSDLVTYASASNIANSAESISGISTYIQIDSLLSSQTAGAGRPWEFGHDNAMSADSSTLIVGAPKGTLNGIFDNIGVVYVFDREGNSYREVGILTAGEYAGDLDEFGHSVACSNDGRRIIVGAWGDEVTGSGSNSGVVYVFDRNSDDTFTRVGILTGSYASNQDDYFGYSVDCSGDGNVIVVGAKFDETGATADTGVVYVFDRSGNNFTEVGIITSSSNAASDAFGESVAISEDGNTIVASAFADGSNDEGIVYVFDRVGVNTFTQVGILTGFPYADDSSDFGNMVKISSNGKTIVVGCESAEINEAVAATGLVQVFDRNPDNTFTRVGVLTGSYASQGSDYFGDSVSVSADGNTIAVGAFFDELSGTGGGGLGYIFTRQGDTFEEVSVLSGVQRPVLSADGKTVAFGNPTYNSGGSNAGRVIIYEQQRQTYLHSTSTGNIGIGVTNPTAKLDVNGSIAINNHSIVSITTSHTASAGTPFTIDTFATSENDLAEYTIHVGYGTYIQAQKVLVMQDGTTAYSQEYAVMSQPSKIVTIEASISGSNVLLQATPETGISGITTYKIVRGGLS